MTSITLRWAGPADAAAGSTYKIERTLANSSWTELAAAQAATSPYASKTNTLAGNTAYGAASVVLVSGSAFSSAGYGYIDDALIQWTGKSSDTLTGVSWKSGSGTYASGTAVVEAHESFSDTATIGLNAVLYRITHILGGVSAPSTYVWYFAPPAPASADHCVVIVAVATDLGFDPQETVLVTCLLATSDQVTDVASLLLLANEVPAVNSQTTNAFGLAFFQCWKNSARHKIGAATDAAYTFTIAGTVIVPAATIPDRDWVLLSQVAT